LIAATVAPLAALVGSCTVPVILPPSCAQRDVVDKTSANAAISSACEDHKGRSGSREDNKMAGKANLLSALRWMAPIERLARKSQRVFLGGRYSRSERMIEDLLRPQHLLLILAAALFLFGPKKLPDLGKGLGEGIRGFKDALKGASHESMSIPEEEK
jgi:sec-independent protein translocase protein TatA